MKRFLLFILLIIGCGFCFAQNIDSLWVVYNNRSEADTNRLKAIDAIVLIYINSNPDTAIILAEQQLDLAKKTKQKKHEGKALKAIGTAYMFKGDYLKSLEYYFECLKVHE